MAFGVRLGWPGARALAQAFGLGLLIALGQAPFGMVYVAFPALVLLLIVLRRAETGRAAFWLGLFAGAGHFGLALSWIVQPFFVDPWRHGWMAPFALVLMAFGAGLFWAVAAAAAQRMPERLVALVVALAAADLLRGTILTGFPWALHGHILLNTPLEQLAALIGGYGLSFLVLAAAALPVAAPRAGAVGLIVAIGLAAVWSNERLGQPEPAPPGGIVRVVQPNVAQTLKWDSDEARGTFERLLALTSAPPAASAPMPVLAIWPETAVPYLLTEGEGAAVAIGAIGLPVVAGIQRVDGDRAWNSLALIGLGGAIGPVYDKVHLVPFGEYIPFGDLAYGWFGIRAFAAQQGFGYSTGTKAQLMDFGLGLGLARPLICYEAIFPEEIGTEVRPGWLLQVTNDAWFGTLTGPYQHFELARLRAIEQGLPLVRAANTGISAVVDARGRVVRDMAGAPALLALGQMGVIDAVLPAALPLTPYAHWGDGPLIGVLLSGFVFSSLRRRAVDGT